MKTLFVTGNNGPFSLTHWDLIKSVVDETLCPTNFVKGVVHSSLSILKTVLTSPGSWNTSDTDVVTKIVQKSV